MGRNRTGAITKEEALRVDLSFMLKKGFIRKGCNISGSLSWSNGSNINFESYYTEEKKYLRLIYSFTKRDSGEVIKQDYKIQLTTIPSNLGRGEVVYFVCPITGRKARFLFNCYGSLIWKSRKAYSNRIYYNSQQCSKNDYHNTRYWSIEKELERCYKRSKKSQYQGNETRLRRRIKLLETKRNFHDWERYMILEKAMQKHS